MKTDKFEKTIRQKLESISPDFHENDWAKMQNYMQVHNPPTFWQQYGSWLGYAAATSVSTVMAFLYINQLSQNNNLVSDVKQLQNQIAVIKSAPPLIRKTDTIYIVQKELTKDQFLERESQNFSESENTESHILRQEINQSEIVQQNNKPALQEFRTPDDKPVYAENNIGNRKSDNTELSEGKAVPETSNATIAEKNNDILKSGNRESFNQKPVQEVAVNQPNENFRKTGTYNHQLENNQSGNTGNIEIAENNTALPPVQSSARTLDESFNQLTEIQSVSLKNSSRQMNYALANRLSSRQARKVWLANTAASSKMTVDVKKTEKIAKAENTIPRLNLKVPYRFGAGMQFEGRNQIKTVTGEVLISKKFSLSTGVSWLKVKPMEFFNEKIFRDKNRKDFKRSHPNEVPMAFEIKNISVKPTLVQIPLTIAFRSGLNHNFSYYVGAGTNVTLNGKEKFSFDCMVPSPNRDRLTKSFERKMDVPLINSVNFSAGIEKTWHPVVLQLEGYVYSYFKQLSPESQRTGPGVKIKLLYQIGGKM